MELYKHDISLTKPIHGFPENYRATPQGTIISKKKKGWATLKPSLGKDGYLRQNFTFLGFPKTFYVHRLIAQAFLGEIPQNLEINHIDNNKQNCSPTNLELTSHSQNINKARKQGQWKSTTVTRTLIKASKDKIHTFYPSITIAAKHLNCDQSEVVRAFQLKYKLRQHHIKRIKQYKTQITL